MALSPTEVLPSLLRSVSLGPQFSDSIVFLPVLRILSSDGANQGIAWVAVRQKGADREENLRDGQRRRPFILEYVQADDTLGVYVAMVDPSTELDFRWLEGILRREVYIQKEDATFVHRPRWAQYGRNPLEKVVSLRSSAAVRRRIQGNAAQLFLDSFSRSGQGFRHFWGPSLGLLLGLFRCIGTRPSLGHFSICRLL